MKLFGIWVVVLLGLGLLVYFRDRKYDVTKETVIDLLRRVLEGKAHPFEWDDFTHIPIKDDPYLDSIRKQCLELEKNAFLDPTDSPWANAAAP